GVASRSPRAAGDPARMAPAHPRVLGQARDRAQLRARVAVGREPGAGLAHPVTATVAERRFQGADALELRSGSLASTFVPSVGMTGVSLRRGRREYLALPGGVDALRDGHTGGLPLLAPWANRLGARRYRAAGVDVDLRRRRLHTDDNGL